MLVQATGRLLPALAACVTTPQDIAALFSSLVRIAALLRAESQEATSLSATLDMANAIAGGALQTELNSRGLVAPVQVRTSEALAVVAGMLADVATSSPASS